MATNDEKSFNFNINIKQVAIVLIAFVLCFIAIYNEALALGYIILTAVLGVFFLAVAFDFGLEKSKIEAVHEVDPESPAGEASAPRRGGRNARTA